MAVGSKAEMILLSVLLVAAAALYPLSHVGFRDALQAVLKSFDIAVEQYARVSGTHWYALELTATDNLTLERIHCRCPVVGTWKNSFIVLHDGQPRAVGKSEPFTTLPFVRPGGDILLKVEGWPKVSQVLVAIDATEAAGVDPCDAAPDHWRHVHNRIAAGQPPRPYTMERHRAWLKRREIER